VTPFSKNGLTAVSAAHHMVNRALVLYPFFSWPGEKLAEI